jgi:glycosyltransferase involved in cell wall biosynthesis
MRLLVLPRYDRLGASSRLRMMQYRPYLEARGLQVNLAPLFSDSYVAGLQQNRTSLVAVFMAYAKRIRVLLSARQYDLLWIEKECLPWLPAWVERLLLPGNVPYVLDYDDAVFHYYDQHRSIFVRRLLGNKHSHLMRGATVIVAGSAYLASVAEQSGAKKIELVPTVIDLTRYPIEFTRNEVCQSSIPPCVGWIGQRATARFLQPYKPIFERLAAAGNARFVAVGINAESLGLPMESVAWSEDTEVASIAGMDIGIMPLVDEPFERGKCGYKLIQYMACGLPVVASPVGANCQIVEHGVNGFLAETPEQWEQALQALLSDPALRQRMGLAGRRKVEEQYCIQVTGPKMADLLLSAA